MFKLESLACGSFGLMVSALLLFATVAPVAPAQAEAQEHAALCGDAVGAAGGFRTFLA